LVEQQRQRFIEKFGRDPGPDDPVFFDLDEDKLKATRADTCVRRAYVLKNGQ